MLAVVGDLKWGDGIGPLIHFRTEYAALNLIFVLRKLNLPSRIIPITNQKLHH